MHDVHNAGTVLQALLVEGFRPIRWLRSMALPRRVSLPLLCLLASACASGKATVGSAAPESQARSPSSPPQYESVLPDDLVSTWPPEWTSADPGAESPYGGTIQENIQALLVDRGPVPYREGSPESLGLSPEPLRIEWGDIQEPAVGRYGIHRSQAFLRFQAHARLSCGQHPVGEVWLKFECGKRPFQLQAAEPPSETTPGQRLRCQSRPTDVLSGPARQYRVQVQVDVDTISLVIADPRGKSAARTMWSSSPSSTEQLE